MLHVLGKTGWCNGRWNSWLISETSIQHWCANATGCSSLTIDAQSRFSFSDDSIADNAEYFWHCELDNGEPCLGLGVDGEGGAGATNSLPEVFQGSGSFWAVMCASACTICCVHTECCEHNVAEWWLLVWKVQVFVQWPLFVTLVVGHGSFFENLLLLKQHVSTIASKPDYYTNSTKSTTHSTNEYYLQPFAMLHWEMNSSATRQRLANTVSANTGLANTTLAMRAPTQCRAFICSDSQAKYHPSLMFSHR